MTARGSQGSEARTSRNKEAHTALLVLIGVYLLLGAIYSVSLPILEAPDEMWHFAYVRYLVRERQLPPWDTDSPVGQESSQPPLYYTAAALATARIDASSPGAFLDRNPHWGYPSAGTVNDNKNMFFHRQEGAEAFPWRDTAMAVHVARLVNLVFGALTVASTYRLAREIFPDRRGLVISATAVVAFSPQFLFISAAVNNDAATSAFSTAALWLLVRGLRSGYTPGRVGMLGTVVGLAALSKVSALALVPFATAVIALRTWLLGAPMDEATADEAKNQRENSFVRFLLLGSLFMALVLAVSGWWYVRNALLYGDPFGLGTHLETWWAHDEPLSFADVWTRLPNIELSYWAAFGWGNVHLPRVFYIMVRVAVRLALVGLLAWAFRAWQARKHPGARALSLALLALWTLAVFAALIRWMQLVEAALGRLLFPAIGAIAVLITWGLHWLSFYILHGWPGATHARQRPVGLSALLAAGLLCAALASPFAVIKPAYARPPLLSDEEVASRSAPITVQFGDNIQLTGVDVRPQSAEPGEEIRTTLCWKAIAPITKNYAYFVHILGPNERIVGARDTHPGLGRFPTSEWTPRASFCDVVRVPVEDDTPTPAVYDIEIGWYEPHNDGRLPAYGADGTPLEIVTVGKIEIVSGEPPTSDVPNPVSANLGDRVTLLGYEVDDATLQAAAGETVDVTLYWEAQTQLTADYTVFIHLSEPASSPYAQDDGQPRDGTYPTSYWDVGRVVTDSHTLRVPDDLPPGHYPLVTGMYLLETGERLTAFDEEGRRLPADAVPLTEVEILP